MEMRIDPDPNSRVPDTQDRFLATLLGSGRCIGIRAAEVVPSNCQDREVWLSGVLYKTLTGQTCEAICSFVTLPQKR